MDIQPSKDSKQDADSAFKRKDYESDFFKYSRLWESSLQENFFALSRIGQISRKINKGEEYITLCRNIPQKEILENKYVRDALCWCLYDCHIKDYDFKNSEEFDQFIQSATYIQQHLQQKDADNQYVNPYVLTIQKVIKVLSKKASPNYKKIIIWLDYLEPNILSDVPFPVTDNSGKKRELASPKEFYYQHYAKALQKTEQFSECINKCDDALNQIKKLHYRNNIWFNGRRLFCKCMIQEDKSDAIDDFESFAKYEKKWFFFHQLAQVCYRFNKIERALLFASQAFNCESEYEKKVNLMYDLGLLWQSKSNTQNANLFFQASAYYRELNHWSIPEELQYIIKASSLDKKSKPDTHKLKEISSLYILSTKISGKVIKILAHGKSGFIAPDTGGTNVYFNVRDVQGQIIEGANVRYELSEDKKQNKPIAINILVVEE